MSAETRPTYRPTSTDTHVGRHPADTSPPLGRQLAGTLPTLGGSCASISTEYRSILSVGMSTDSRPISRPILGRHIDRHQPTRMSADTRPILHRHLADTRPTLRSIGRCLAVVASPVNCDCFFQRCFVSYLSWALPHLFIPSFIRKPGNESCLSYRSIPARMKARRKKLVYLSSPNISRDIMESGRKYY